MKIKIFIFTVICLRSFCCATDGFKDNSIQYDKVQLTPEEKQIVGDALKRMHENYDPEWKMLAGIHNGYNYHTDAISGRFHHVRSSFNYAGLLLDSGDEQYTQRAFDVIEKTISLQDQDNTSESCGVWPYYQEEPLATKKSPIDFNWADFNAVSLLDVWMGHQDEIPADLKPKIKNALLLAAKSIQKRNVGLDYTNIAIMGTYVTYMVSHLFDLPEMKKYATFRLKRFYDHTLDKGGFSEYNSPTYTIVALDGLFRMKSHIIEPLAKQQIDSLYSMGWEIIARHYHKPSGQWAGPHSRSYSTLVKPSFYAILKEGSDGKIDFGIEEKRSDVKIKHQIPAHLLHYFLTPEYPRTESDVFEKEEPRTIGTCYMTEKYALSTANRSSLWNQRRPFLVYWGDIKSPKYLQVRFMHDDYDFSAATFHGRQKESRVLAAINFIANGGDKHISIDRLKEGKFMAKDLRLRFEFGNVKSPEDLSIPTAIDDPFVIDLDHLKFNFQMYSAEFDGARGHWEKGGDGKASWIDFVFYSGAEKEIDLTKMNRAVCGFIFELDSTDKKKEFEKADVSEKEGILKIEWTGLKLETPVKPQAPDAKPKDYDLRTFPKGKTPQEVGTRIAEKFLKTAHSRYGNTHPDTQPTQITYPDVCTWLGGMWFANITQNGDLFNRFQSRFTPLFDAEKHLQPQPNHVDNNVFGSVPLELYLKTKQRKYLDLGLKYADTQWILPEGAKPEEKSWADQGYSWQTRIWIDDMFMITAVQAQAYRATGDRKYIDRAAEEMVVYLDKLQLENGLFYHSPEAHFSWGRGNGWMAVGMAEMLRILPNDNPNRPRILDGYHKMMAALLKFQEKDGMWRQIIDDPEAWKETSGTAMFTYAFITGVKNGWLDKVTYGTAARKGWLALILYINSEDELTEVCEGTNIKNDRNHYMRRKRIVGDLHGQAPVLWCATALLR